MARTNVREIPVESTGSDGTATGSVDVSDEQGLLHSIVIRHGATTPIGTVVVVKEKNGAGRTFLTQTASGVGVANDGEFPVRQATADVSAGAGSDETMFMLGGTELEITVSVTNALNPAVTVYLHTIDGMP